MDWEEKKKVGDGGGVMGKEMELGDGNELGNRVGVKELGKGCCNWEYDKKKWERKKRKRGVKKWGRKCVKRGGGRISVSVG